MFGAIQVQAARPVQRPPLDPLVPRVAPARGMAPAGGTATPPPSMSPQETIHWAEAKLRSGTLNSANQRELEILVSNLRRQLAEAPAVHHDGYANPHAHNPAPFHASGSFHAPAPSHNPAPPHNLAPAWPQHQLATHAPIRRESIHDGYPDPRAHHPTSLHNPVPAHNPAPSHHSAPAWPSQHPGHQPPRPDPRSFQQRPTDLPQSPPRPASFPPNREDYGRVLLEQRAPALQNPPRKNSPLLDPPRQAQVAPPPVEIPVPFKFDLAFLKDQHAPTLKRLLDTSKPRCSLCGMRFQSDGLLRGHMDWHFNIRQSQVCVVACHPCAGFRWVPFLSFFAHFLNVSEQA
eukprot:m.149179 g.149179  ORF g.149179 m.149179 type:complete len:346 (+) comp52757_c0_seq9:77-1114(+)